MKRTTADDFAVLNARIRDIEIPPRMRALPISDTGYPVPWFVAKVQGAYDFRVADQDKLKQAINKLKPLCWLCGQPLGRHFVFVLGPMCAVNRVTSEPPCHRDCAEYAIKACPFLTKPNMRRNVKDLPDQRLEPAGYGLDRNPGAVVMWTTKTFTAFNPDHGKPGLLFRVGPPEHLTYWCEGRAATRDEVRASIDSGMPLLRRVAKLQGSEHELDKQYATCLTLLPAA